MEPIFAANAAQRSLRYDLQLFAGESMVLTMLDRPVGATISVTLGADMLEDPLIELAGSDAISLTEAALEPLPEGDTWQYCLWLEQDGTRALVWFGSFSKRFSVAPTAIADGPQPEPLTITGLPQTASVAGQAWSFYPIIAGGTGPYSFALSGGSLPVGVTLNPATGALTGVPNSAGQFVDLVLSVSDAGGDTASLAPFTLEIAPAQALALVSAPVISGTAQVGHTITASAGVWSGSEPRSYGYQWQRDGVDIAGAVSSSHTLLAIDDLTALSCTVTASDGVTQISAAASAVAVVYPVPVNTSLPAITGTFAAAEVLSVSDGSWSAPVTISRQWTRDGADISGATTASYTVQSGDAGTVIGCVVSASNSGGVVPVTASGAQNVAATAGPDALLLFVSGQSNARTAGTSSLTPPVRYTDGSLGDVQIFIRGTGANVLAEIAAGTFQPYDVTSNADPDNNGTAWGSEAEFIYQMRQAGDMRPVYVVKEAQNGQNLAADWYPDTTADNFEFAEAKASRARTLLTGTTLEDVTLWNQGEADANTEVTADAYAANWTYFLQQYRSRVSTGLFIAERIRPLGYLGATVTTDSAGFLRAWKVREATLAGVLADGNAKAIDLDFDTSNFSNIHPVEPWIENKGTRCYAAYDGSYDATYGSIFDTAPTAFAFTDIVDATPSAVVTSDAVLIGGIERQSPVTVTGGEFRTLNSLDSDALVSDWATSGYVDKFQKLQLRATASGAASTAVNVVATVGGVSDTWTVTTFASAPSYEPETDAFIAQVNTNGGLAISGADADALDAFYVTAKASTWLAKLLRLYLRMGDQVASSLDMVDRATSLELVNPSGLPYVWSAAGGWTPQENSNTGIDLRVDPSVQLPQDNSTIGAFYSAFASNTRSDLNAGSEIYFRNLQSGSSRFKMNSSGNSNASGLSTLPGLRAMVRGPANTGIPDLRLHGADGSIIATSTNASAAPLATGLCLGNAIVPGTNMTGGTHSDAAFFGAVVAGAALSEVEMQSLATACNTLLAHFAP